MLSLKSNAQFIQDLNEIQVTYNKTSSIVFPAIIKSVDRGSRDLLAQKAKGVENILQLKAARKEFQETNLTVITADGIIHQFSVRYAKEPSRLVFEIIKAIDNDMLRQSNLIFNSEIMQSEMERYSKQIVNRKRHNRFITASKHKIKLSLFGIYIKDNVIFYHFKISNLSNINYDVDFLRLFIEDQVKVKRTASQEVDIKPLYIYGNNSAVKGNSSEDIVYALEKFTIPDAKRLNIEVFEKNGGRNLTLRIKNKTIVNAQLIQ